MAPLLEQLPPSGLTQEEFRSNWEPKGWKLIIIGPTATWREEWGEWEAIRDIVQNALDETEAYTAGRDKEGFYIADKGKGIGIADFLLGPPKLKPAYARGKFGEGMKIAALTLIRKGYKVRVSTVGKDVWIVFMKVQVDGHVDQLAALWRPDGTSIGTKFYIMGYEGPDFADRFAVNLRPAVIVHTIPAKLTSPIMRKNQLISAPAGRIYGRDIFMKEIKSPYSYNLWSFEMAPDRHGAKNESEIWTDAGRLWATITLEPHIVRLLKMTGDPPGEITDETTYLSLSSWDLGVEPVSGKHYLDIMKENAPVWKKAWKIAYGNYGIVRTNARWDNMVKHLGYQPVGLTYGMRDALALVIKCDVDLIQESQDKLRSVKIIKDETLDARTLRHLNLARAINLQFMSPAKAVYAAIIPPASDRNRTSGLYDRSIKEIYISLEQLGTGRETVDTYIHEMAHHTSGGEDGEVQHNDAMTSVGSRVVEYVASGKLNEVLKDVIWR